MKNFLISERIKLSHDQDISDVKEGLKKTLEQMVDINEISADAHHFYIRGSTGGLFDFVRSAKVFAEVDMSVEETKSGKDLRLIIKGNAVLSYSQAFVYFIFFFLILLAGLLPGSIETGSENSTALDALVFLLVGYYIKTEITRVLREAEQHFRDSVTALSVKFGV